MGKTKRLQAEMAELRSTILADRRENRGCFDAIGASLVDEYDEMGPIAPQLIDGCIGLVAQAAKAGAAIVDDRREHAADITSLQSDIDAQRETYGPQIGRLVGQMGKAEEAIERNGQSWAALNAEHGLHVSRMIALEDGLRALSNVVEVNQAGVGSLQVALTGLAEAVSGDKNPHVIGAAQVISRLLIALRSRVAQLEIARPLVAAETVIAEAEGAPTRSELLAMVRDLDDTVELARNLLAHTVGSVDTLRGRVEQLEAAELERGLDEVGATMAQAVEQDLSDILANVRVADRMAAELMQSALDAVREDREVALTDEQRETLAGLVAAEPVASAKTEQDWREVARCIPWWDGALVRSEGGPRIGFAYAGFDRDADCGTSWWVRGGLGAYKISDACFPGLDHGPTFRESVYRLAEAMSLGDRGSGATIGYNAIVKRWWIARAGSFRDVGAALPEGADRKLVLATAWAEYLGAE